LCSARLAFHPAHAADPKIDAAVKTFKSLGGDAGKMKTFCAMMKAMDAAGETPTPAAQSQIEGFTKQLGPDLRPPGTSAEKVDENSATAKAWKTRSTSWQASARSNIESARQRMWR